jgi:hypothetical protein
LPTRVIPESSNTGYRDDGSERQPLQALRLIILAAAMPAWHETASHAEIICNGNRQCAQARSPRARPALRDELPLIQPKAKIAARIAACGSAHVRIRPKKRYLISGTAQFVWIYYFR